MQLSRDGLSFFSAHLQKIVKKISAASLDLRRRAWYLMDRTRTTVSILKRRFERNDDHPTHSRPARALPPSTDGCPVRNSARLRRSCAVRRPVEAPWHPPVQCPDADGSPNRGTRTERRASPVSGPRGGRSRSRMSEGRILKKAAASDMQLAQSGPPQSRPSALWERGSKGAK